MPSTRFEYIVGALGTAAVLVLAVLTALAWRDYRDASPASSLSGTTEQVSVRGPARVTRTSGPSTGTVNRATAPAPSPPVTASRPTKKPSILVLRATRGESWLSARIGSQAGSSLYEGLLRRGHARRFKDPVIWLRLGAPQNVDAVVKGKRAPLPPSTATVLFAHNRLTTVALG